MKMRPREMNHTKRLTTRNKVIMLSAVECAAGVLAAAVQSISRESSGSP